MLKEFLEEILGIKINKIEIQKEVELNKSHEKEKCRDIIIKCTGLSEKDLEKAILANKRRFFSKIIKFLVLIDIKVYLKKEKLGEKKNLPVFYMENIYYKR